MTNFRLLVILVILPAIVRAQPYECCDGDVAVQVSNSSICEDGKLVQMDCNSIKLILSNEEGPYSFSSYKLMTDDDKKFVYAPEMKSEWHGSDFCEGYSRAADNTASTRIAVVCGNRRIWRDREQETKDRPLKLYTLAIEVANFLSMLTLAITAFLYFYLPEMDNTEGKCIFHLSLCMGIAHAGSWYLLVTEQRRILPNLCITNLYLQIFLVLTFFCWTGVISFDMWNRTRSRRRFDESKLMRCYYCFGYGVPCLLILSSNIAAHLKNLYDEYRLELQCYKHESMVSFTFVFLPIAAVLFSNLFFFIDVQRRLWKIQPSSQQNDNFSLKKLKYRLSMNGKLFYIMGIPWLCLFISTFFYILTKRVFYGTPEWYLVTARILALIVSGEGVWIFLILVVLRPRMCKAISRRWPAFENLLTRTADHDAESLTDELPYDANSVNI